MSNALLSSKIVTVEDPPRISTFTALPTATAGMVGVTERGPVGTATLATSFDEWSDIFGGYTLDARDTVAAVEGFFEEGGQFLWFVRTARYTDINDVNSLEALIATGTINTAATTTGPPTLLGNLAQTFALVDGDTLLVSLNGAGAVTSTFNAARAEIVSGNAETYDFEVQAGETAALSPTYALTDGNTLLVSVDGEAALVITFNTADFAVIAAATVVEIIAVILAQHPTDLVGTDDGGDLRISNARTVITGRTLQITGGTDAAAFNFPGVLIQGQGSGDTVDVSIDGEAALNFQILAADYADLNAATSAEMISAVTAQFAADLGADASGTSLRLFNSRGIGTGFSIEVLGTGTADATVLNFAGGAVNGTGDAANAAAVTVAELKLLFEADIAGILVTNVSSFVQIQGLVNGAAETLQVTSTSTLDTKLGLSNLAVNGTDAAVATLTLTINAKYPGEYGNDVTVRIDPASSGDADQFNLLVLEDGVVREQFNNLTMDDTATQGFIEDVINANPSQGGSLLISVVDEDAGLGSPTLDRPSDGTNTLASGTNGLTNIGDIHFIGSSVALNGLRALDNTKDVRLLSVPARATAAVHNAMLTYAEVTRLGTMVAVLDPPAGLTAQEMVTYVETTALLLEASEFGIVYFPRVTVLNPNTTLFGNDESITVPPSGHVMGRYSRQDSSSPGGIYKPPAGLSGGRLGTITGLEILANKEVPETFDVNKRDLLYPKRINPISEISGGRILDGVRMLMSSGNFPTIAERRGVIFIETTTRTSLEPVRFRNNDDTLRAEAARAVEAFLTNQMRVGAFRSNDPSKAFSVDFGRGLNTDTVIFAGQLIGRIGLATQKPAEFIILRFTQDTRALEQELSQP